MAKSNVLKPARQIILWIAANAGGVGKTTLGIHIGYKFAQMGLNVLFIDLDTAQQAIPCFPGIRFSIEFENASNRGMAPLDLYRPKHPACKDFQPIINSLTKEFQSASRS